MAGLAVSGPFFYAEEMVLEFEKKLARFVEANDLFGSAEKILLAVSGGADSTALLYAMQALRAEKVFNAEFFCAHVNHQLRGRQADLDEAFVVAQAAELKLPVTTRRVDVRGCAGRNKLSIETAARQLRIEALTDIARAGRCDRIATAHQKNDNAETVLHRLIRGTGFRGLAGIWPAKVFAGGMTFVRPLLCVTRREIVEYLQRRNLKWRRDRTNADCTYRRNYIRHRLLPVLQRAGTDSIVEQLSELSRRARALDDLIERRVAELWPSLADCTDERTSLNLNMFQTQPHPVKVELIRRSLAGIGCGQRDLTQRHYERILQLTGQDVTGGKMELPGGFCVQREYGKLIFAQPERKACFDGRTAEPVRLKVPGQTRFGGYLIEASVSDADNSREKSEIGNRKSEIPASSGAEWFDLEKVKLPLTVRPRRAGDRFVPLGLGEEKKLGKFLTAQRVPHRVRGRVLVVADGEKILWVWPIRIGEQAKITGQTRKILQLQITDSSGDKNKL
jgi:tRNA(Ile)-lysidine synthase